MSVLKNVLNNASAEDRAILDKAADDHLGGFTPLNSDIYAATVKDAFLNQAGSGAIALRLILQIDGGREYREDLWVVNRNGTSFNSDGETPMGGYQLANKICGVLADKSFSLCWDESQEQVKKIYDANAGTEVNATRDTLMDLLGRKIYVGIIKHKENKNVKDVNGEYVPTAEIREANHIDNFFDFETKLTYKELDTALNSGVKPEDLGAHAIKLHDEGKLFYDAWIKGNQGKVDESRVKQVRGGAAPTNQSQRRTARQATANNQAANQAPASTTPARRRAQA